MILMKEGRVKVVEDASVIIGTMPVYSHYTEGSGDKYMYLCTKHNRMWLKALDSIIASDVEGTSHS